MMNLYHISQDVYNGYDTYSDAIVAAENEDEARKMHPADYVDGEWWISDYSRSWADTLEQVQVKLIGIAYAAIKKGVICASFHAG